MFAFNVNQEKVSHIPYTLKEWTREQGPKTLVREMELDRAQSAERAWGDYTLKGWANHHGAHTQLVALGNC